jgi:hypothetical protein
VVDKVPPLLSAPAFAEKRLLWIKESKHPSIHYKDIQAKRYEYVKIGRTFGFETTRYLSFAQGHLFYYDGESDKEYRGYCAL